MRIHTIDLLFQGCPEAIASFLVEGDTGLALVETGPATTRQALLEGIRAAGHDPADITDVLVSHIHLDHAGDAGWWAAEQGARVWVHENGARHLVDPSKLIESATRVYGDRMDSLWGTLTPAPADLVRAVSDGDKIEVGDLSFTALDTPGHARHHLCFALGDTVFAGDLAGVRLPGQQFTSLASAPPQFELETYAESFAKVLACKAGSLQLTHFGQIDDPTGHLEHYAKMLRKGVEFAQGLDPIELGLPAHEEGYREFLRETAASEGTGPEYFERYETANPSGMSIDGILLYLKKKAKSEREGETS